MLGRVDPPPAAAYSVELLAASESADEWAVAMRNYAAQNDSPEGRRFLREKLDAMIRHDPWRRDPSAGFLEAFDVAVWIGGAGLLSSLAECVRDSGNPAVAHAAYLAMDRLVIQEPETVLPFLLREPGLLAGREELEPVISRGRTWVRPRSASRSKATFSIPHAARTS